MLCRKRTDNDARGAFAGRDQYDNRFGSSPLWAMEILYVFHIPVRAIHFTAGTARRSRFPPCLPS